MSDDPREAAPVEPDPSEGKPEKKKAAKKTRRPNGKSERKPAARGGIGSRLSPEKVSDDERKVLIALKKAKEPTKVSEIAATCWSGKRTKGDSEGSTSAYRRVLNALRRLRARSLVKSERTTEEVPGKKTGRTYNLYALSAAGTKFVENME